VDEHVIEFVSLVTGRLEFRQSADIFNRVMPKDNIALVALLRHVATGEDVVVANPHMTWDPAFADVKLVQTALFMDELGRRYRRAPSSTGGAGPPLVICGDFNSLPGSAVYQFVANGHLAKGHADLAGRAYGPYTEEDLHHRFRLASAYAPLGELPFTNRTPGFTGTIDFVWYSLDRLAVCAVLGPVPQDYSDRIVGMPNVHFPSDHVSLCVELAFLPKSTGKSDERGAGAAPMPWMQPFGRGGGGS
jgi:CCR4-NOT transcription complex subunit 6